MLLLMKIVNLISTPAAMGGGIRLPRTSGQNGDGNRDRPQRIGFHLAPAPAAHKPAGKQHNSGPAQVFRAWIFAGRKDLLSATCRVNFKPVKPSRKPAPASAPAAAAFLSLRADGVWLAVKLQPRASKNEIGEPLGDELKIKVTAPPVDAAANQALIEFLAQKLDCSRGRVELIRGHTSRHKTIRLHGFKPAEVLQKLVRV